MSWPGPSDPHTGLDTGAAPAARGDRPSAWFDTLPVFFEERIWGFADLTLVMTGLAIATWAFLIGGTTITFVGFKAGLAANVIGVMVGTAIIAASVLGAAKYGQEHYTFLRSHFGRHGVKPLVYAWMLAVTVGWNAVLAVMFGRASTNVVNAMLDTAFSVDSLVVAGFGLLALGLTWLIVVRGPGTIRWVNRLAAPGLVVVMLGMLYLLLREYRYDDFLAFEPLDPYGLKPVDFMIAVELNLAAMLSYWPGLGSLARLARTQRGAFWAFLIGLGVMTALAQALGMMTALALGQSDPTAWMIPVGGGALGPVALAWIAFANVTSMASVVYVFLVAARQEGVRFVGRLSWSACSALVAVATAVLLVRPTWIYDHFLNFILWTGLGYGPAIGISMADYFLLRRQRVDLRALYDERAGSPYDFWGGWNWPALIALAVGSVSYLAFLDPKSLAYHGWFPYTTATLPSMAAGILVYLVLTQWVVKPRGLGGY